MRSKHVIDSHHLHHLKQEINTLERKVNYYKELSDEVAGYNIVVDSQIIFLKRDLDQKRIGYDILKRLHDIIGTQIDIDKFFESTLQLILTHLKMDKAVVLLKDKNGKFQIEYCLGYQKEEEALLRSVPMEMAEINQLEDPHLLLNKASRKQDFHTTLCEQLQMPFIVGVPIRTKKTIDSWLIAGREKEARPFYPPLMPGDLELFEVMGGFVKATVSNFQLYANLEKANLKLANYNKELEAKVEERTRDIELSRKELEKEKVKSDGLLLNILPTQVAHELKERGESKARSLKDVTILFTDFVNFTHFAQNMSPEELVSELHECFTAFDNIIGTYKLEKIKTIGDAYMAAGGMDGKPKSSCINLVKAAIEMQEYIKRRVATKHFAFSMRVGINTGNVVAGIVGLRKFQYDIWGDTVNTAARMESSGQVEKVNISAATYETLKDCKEFAFEYRGALEAKGKGKMDMWFVSKA